MQKTKLGMFYGTGSGTAKATIGAEVGQIVCARMAYTSAAAGTLVIYRPDIAARANAAVSASATLVIKTDATGYVEGYTPTTSDYVLVGNSTTSGTTWYLQSISSVAGVSSSTRSLGLGGNIYCAADDFVFICKAANLVSITTGTETVNQIYDAFVGFKNMPVHVLLTATGTDMVSGKYEVWD